MHVIFLLPGKGDGERVSQAGEAGHMLDVYYQVEDLSISHVLYSLDPLSCKRKLVGCIVQPSS